MPEEHDLSLLQAVLRERGIKTMRSVPTEPGLVSIAMTTYSVQEFLNVIAPGPISDDDELAVRILGRPQDMGIADVAWRFEAVPTIRDMESGLEVRVIVSLPPADLPEVLRRLGAT